MTTVMQSSGRHAAAHFFKQQFQRILVRIAVEGSHSGLVHVPGKDESRKGPRVRISHPPQ